MLSTCFGVIEPYGHHLHMLKWLGIYSSLSEVISKVYSIRPLKVNYMFLVLPDVPGAVYNSSIPQLLQF